jgi:hypothetical protein
MPQFEKTVVTSNPTDGTPRRGKPVVGLKTRVPATKREVRELDESSKLPGNRPELRDRAVNKTPGAFEFVSLPPHQQLDVFLGSPQGDRIDGVFWRSTPTNALR